MSLRYVSDDIYNLSLFLQFMIQFSVIQVKINGEQNLQLLQIMRDFSPNSPRVINKVLKICNKH